VRLRFGLHKEKPIEEALFSPDKVPHEDIPFLIMTLNWLEEELFRSCITFQKSFQDMQHASAAQSSDSLQSNCFVISQQAVSVLKEDEKTEGITKENFQLEPVVQPAIESTAQERYPACYTSARPARSHFACAGRTILIRQLAQSAPACKVPRTQRAASETYTQLVERI
jgi:hypothetical protein